MWLLLVTCLWVCSTTYQILYALNCGGQTQVYLDSIQYSTDRFYSQGSTSVSKNYISRSIKDTMERMLIRTQRTSTGNFSYYLPFSSEGRFGLILRFYEYEFTSSGQRVFSVKLGDQKLFNIDIIEEVGSKKPLTKFIEFDIKDGIAYLQSIPALNAYDYSQDSIELRFQKIKSNPKIQTIIVIKGSMSQFKRKHIQQYKNQYLTQPAQYLCERLHDAKHNNVYTDSVNIDEVDPLYFLKKIFFTKAGLLSILVFVIILSKQRIFRHLQMYINEIELRHKQTPQQTKDKQKTKQNKKQK